LDHAADERLFLGPWGDVSPAISVFGTGRLIGLASPLRDRNVVELFSNQPACSDALVRHSLERFSERGDAGVGGNMTALPPDEDGRATVAERAFRSLDGPGAIGTAIPMPATSGCNIQSLVHWCARTYRRPGGGAVRRRDPPKGFEAAILPSTYSLTSGDASLPENLSMTPMKLAQAVVKSHVARNFALDLVLWGGFFVELWLMPRAKARRSLRWRHLPRKLRCLLLRLPFAAIARLGWHAFAMVHAVTRRHVIRFMLQPNRPPIMVPAAARMRTWARPGERARTAGSSDRKIVATDEVSQLDLMGMIDAAHGEECMARGRLGRGGFADLPICAPDRAGGVEADARDMQAAVYPRTSLNRLPAHPILKWRCAFRRGAQGCRGRGCRRAAARGGAHVRALHETGRRLSRVRQLLVSAAPRVLAWVSILSALVFLTSAPFAVYAAAPVAWATLGAGVADAVAGDRHDGGVPRYRAVRAVDRAVKAARCGDAGSNGRGGGIAQRHRPVQRGRARVKS
jgi:hypothetical protein